MLCWPLTYLLNLARWIWGTLKKSMPKLIYYFGTFFGLEPEDGAYNDALKFCLEFAFVKCFRKTKPSNMSSKAKICEEN